MHVAAQQPPCGGGRAGQIAFCVGASKIEPVSANVSPAGPRMSASTPRGALLTALAVLALLPACAHAEAQEPVAAVWKERQLNFSYRSFTTVHPCHVLQNRIARVLNALGARSDLQVTLSNCNALLPAPVVVSGNDSGWPQSPSGSSPGSWPTAPYGDGANRPPNPFESRPGAYGRTEPRQVVDVKVRLSVPAEMTPEVLAEMKTDRRRRELIARVTGNPLPLFDDPIAFAAERKVVTLSHETTGIEPTECELLQQIASSVFKKLDVRVVRRRISCDRMSASRVRPTLDAEALVPVTFRPVDAGEGPAPGGENPESPVPEDPGAAPASHDAGQKPGG